MSVSKILTEQIITKVITLSLADRVMADGVALGSRIIRQMQAGEITEDEGYQMARFQDGDALDQSLGRGKRDSGK